MCTFLPPPAITIALPWQAPYHWIGFLIIEASLFSVYFFATFRITRYLDKLGAGRNRLLQTLPWSAMLLITLGMVLDFLVALPSQGPLTSWYDTESALLNAKGCSHDTFFRIADQSLTGIQNAIWISGLIFVASLVTMFIWMLLGIIRIRRAQAK